MKRTDLAYFAGIFDGEGAIGITKHVSKNGYKRGYYFELVVQLANSVEWLPQSLKMAFGGHISFQDASKGSFVGKLPLWRWTAHARQAALFLKAILPYLKLKHYQAEIAIQFQDAKYYGKRRTETQYAVEEAQRILIHSKTSKGKKY